MSVEHVAVIPVKAAHVAKSRLTPVAGTARRRLALAFATDTLQACRDTPRVAQILVVTDDPGFAEHAASLAVDVIGEGGELGLNPVLRRGAAAAATRWPQGRPFALCADLPALRPGELDAALADLDGRNRAGFVVDAAGTGTTLYSAPYDAFAPRFGTDSARAHRAAGAHAVAGTLAGLRQDVDDGADLAAAVARGVGPATAAALAMVPGIAAD